MKKIYISIAIIVLFLGLAFASTFYFDYVYDNTIGSFFTLADDASTLDKKLDYLISYRDALKNNNLDSGQARYIFKTPATDLGKNFELLNVLIQRLDETRSLDTQSFAYQKAIEQITEQEFGGFNKAVFFDGWIRKNVIVYIFNYIGNLSLSIIFFVIFLTFFFSGFISSFKKLRNWKKLNNE